MATNPVVKLKRGVFSNLTTYPTIDGQLFFATSANLQLTSAAAGQDNEPFNIFVLDVDNGTSVIRRNLDAYRAIYAKEAGTATVADAWSSGSAFSITDGTHNGTSTSIDGSQASYSLSLPSTISAAFIGNLTGIADKAKALSSASGELLDIGSSTLPVYFDDGVPVAVSSSLAVSITGSAATADALSSSITLTIKDATEAHSGADTTFDGSSNAILKLPATITATLVGRASTAGKLTDASDAALNIGSNTLPVYFAGGVPVAVGNSLAVDITGNAGSADVADAFSTSAGSSDTPVYINANGVPTAVTSLDATKLSGMVPLTSIPKAAQERMVVKADEAAIKALTTDDSTGVQLGDVVKNQATGDMYYVVDPTTTGIAFKNTANTLGFMEFAAGNAANAVHADTADALSTSRTIGISGGVTGTDTSFDGSGNISIPVTGIDADYINDGVVGVGYGGTGKTSWTQWGIVYADTTSSLAQLGAGTSGYFLVSQGSSAAAAWTNPSDLTVGSADSLSTSRTINGTSFDGTSDITTASWGTARNITIEDNDGTNSQTTTGIDGSTNFTLKLPATIKATLTGKADTAGTADGLAYILSLQTKDVDNTTANPVEYGDPDMAADVSFEIGPDNLFPVFKATGFTANITAGVWTTITTPTNMSTGSYIVQVKAKSATGSKFNNEFFTGTMSFSSANGGGTAQTDSDEVFLHAAGSGLNGERIYLRTRRNGSGKMIIELTSTVNLVQNTDVFDIVFRKMI